MRPNQWIWFRGKIQARNKEVMSVMCVSPLRKVKCLLLFQLEEMSNCSVNFVLVISVLPYLEGMVEWEGGGGGSS